MKFIFQNTQCKQERRLLLCSLYLLTDCAVSVNISENFIYGKVQSDLLSVCKDLKNVFQNESRKAIKQEFYKFYLQLKPVSLFSE